MSDEDAPTFEPPRAAIPSRAGGTPLPPMAFPPLPPVVETAPRTRRNPRPRPAPVKKTQKLPAREIKRITRNRSKNLAKKAKVNVHMRSRKSGVDLRKVAPKNPNRPLELKNQMAAVLGIVASLPKTEAAAFASLMSSLGALSRSGQRRVIAALGQVYQ